MKILPITYALVLISLAGCSCLNEHETSETTCNKPHVPDDYVYARNADGSVNSNIVMQTPLRVSASIPCRELYPGRVIGKLGKGFGTRTIIEGYETSAKLSNPMKVSKIDNVAVTNAIVISIRDHPKLVENRLYCFEGYETGYFGGGTPYWVNADSTVGSQTFCLRTFFRVTSVIQPSTEKKTE